MKNIIKKIIICFIIAGIVFSVAILGDSLFGNPISKNIAKNVALEYLTENYSDVVCEIEDIYYDTNYQDYAVHITSPENENIDFSLYISDGNVNVIEYWKNSDNVKS